MIDLRGRFALVTGGSRGIGAASAIILAQAGAHVALTYRSHRAGAQAVQSAIERLGKTCLILKSEAASELETRKTVKGVLREFGAIDILVNNAGVWKYGAIGAMTVHQWDETLDTNLRSAFLFCNEVVPTMKKKRRGKIVNLSSTAGQRGEPFHSHYAASKAGIIAFTKSIAVELAPFNIAVNCVAPGWVDTKMAAPSLKPRSSRRKIEEEIPRGRIATPEEIAGSILFLASDLSNHLIGATLSVNGGSVMVT